MHACKGLEFDTVFIPDVNEGNVPSRRAWTQDQVEEERRLLYVAMTRARRALTITYLEGTPDRPAAPSRFLGAFGQVLGQTVGQALGKTVGQALGQTGGQAP
jgi:DNA helicase-2/ATP-dependent DNA helicase PcrA